MKRICPLCGKVFKPMSDALWKNALAVHLITAKEHGLSPQEIMEILKNK